MQALRRAAVRKLHRLRPAQAPVQKIRHEQQMIRLRQQTRIAFLHRQQLVEGVQLHELQTGLRKNIRTRNLFERFLHHPVGPRIPVMIRHSDDFIVPRQQHKVHAPGVGADRNNLPAVFLARGGQPGLNFRPESQYVPADGFPQRHRPVGKTVAFFEAKLLAVPDARHHAAAFRSEVKRKINFFRHDSQCRWPGLAPAIECRGLTAGRSRQSIPGAWKRAVAQAF